MYTAGTISGTKGSNKITGKSTQWLSNLYNILEGQVIIIYTPTSSNAYSIKNIKSNTEIELSKPLYDAFTNATYEIFTTLDNTTSDAAVKIATSIARNSEFMTAMNQWTTGTGTVTVNWGNEQIKLTTVDQMNKNIDGKISNKVISIPNDIHIDAYFPGKPCGPYRTGGASLGTPTGGLADYYWINHNNDAQYGVLTAMTLDNRTYRKSLISGKWSDWEPLATGSQLDKKLDKTGGTTTGGITSTSLSVNESSSTPKLNIYSARGASTLAFFQYNDGPNWYGKLNIPRVDLGKTETLMKVGDYGWGGKGLTLGTPTEQWMKNFLTSADTRTQVTRVEATNAYLPAYGVMAYFKSGDTFTALSASHNGATVRVLSGNASNVFISNLLTDRNTTKDANGNIKGASPIVEIYADHVVLNEESEGVELKKLHTGIYQLKGTLGMNSDPSWGGIHGGIVVPNGINGLQLVYADYDVLAVGQPHPFNGEIVPPEENGDIVVYTTYRKHSDLPQNIQRARLKTYPEFTKEVNGEIVELSAGDLVDIPNGHWLDVRVNMPSNSVYNIRQAEQEELARIAAEKAEAEEIERLEREAIEEAERIEREEIERLEREEADRVAEEAEKESYESNDGDQEL